MSRWTDEEVKANRYDLDMCEMSHKIDQLTTAIYKLTDAAYLALADKNDQKVFHDQPDSRIATALRDAIRHGLDTLRTQEAPGPLSPGAPKEIGQNEVYPKMG